MRAQTAQALRMKLESTSGGQVYAAAGNARGFQGRRVREIALWAVEIV